MEKVSLALSENMKKKTLNPQQGKTNGPKEALRQC